MYVQNKQTKKTTSIYIIANKNWVCSHSCSTNPSYGTVQII